MAVLVLWGGAGWLAAVRGPGGPLHWARLVVVVVLRPAATALMTVAQWTWMLCIHAEAVSALERVSSLRRRKRSFTVSLLGWPEWRHWVQNRATWGVRDGLRAYEDGCRWSRWLEDHGRLEGQRHCTYHSFDSSGVVLRTDAFAAT